MRKWFSHPRLLIKPIVAVFDLTDALGGVVTRKAHWSAVDASLEREIMTMALRARKIRFIVV